MDVCVVRVIIGVQNQIAGIRQAPQRPFPRCHQKHKQRHQAPPVSFHLDRQVIDHYTSGQHVSEQPQVRPVMPAPLSQFQRTSIPAFFFFFFFFKGGGGGKKKKKKKKKKL